MKILQMRVVTAMVSTESDSIACSYMLPDILDEDSDCDDMHDDDDLDWR